MLKKANIHVEEDLSKRTRENRNELRKFMRQVIFLLLSGDSNILALTLHSVGNIIRKTIKVYYGADLP